LLAWLDALADLLRADTLDPALLSDLLTPPGEIELSEREAMVDPARIHGLRQALQQRLAERIGADVLQQRYQALTAQSGLSLDAVSQGQRRLKRRLLELLALLDIDTARSLAAAQYAQAPGMTDRLAALAVLVRSGAPQAAAALAQYRTRYAGHALALDKWFTVQAQWPGEPALQRVRALEDDPAFTLKNPNRVQALFGAWARGNPSGFHRPDGAGYRLLAARLAQLDALNPQVAARLATAFNGWQRLEPVRRAAAGAALDELAGKQLSRNLVEIVDNMLKS
jgi:aminopeptidase N